MQGVVWTLMMFVAKNISIGVSSIDQNVRVTSAQCAADPEAIVRVSARVQQRVRPRAKFALAAVK
jgi:hypothetical protein